MSVNVCGARGWQARYAAVGSGTFRQAGSDFSRFADGSNWMYNLLGTGLSISVGIPPQYTT